MLTKDQSSDTYVVKLNIESGSAGVYLKVCHDLDEALTFIKTLLPPINGYAQYEVHNIASGVAQLGEASDNGEKKVKYIYIPSIGQLMSWDAADDHVYEWKVDEAVSPAPREC